MRWYSSKKWARGSIVHMPLFLFRIIFVSILVLFCVDHLSASGYVKYTPANTIALSGSNTQVRFDVATEIYTTFFPASPPVPPPSLSTVTRSFSWAFYLSGAGWVLMSTGSYTTRLDCGIQYLSWLTSNCILSGSAWSETIGDIVFDRRVEYMRDTGTLSGKISTLIGDVSLDGVILPLLPTTLSGSSYTGMADHQTHFEIGHPEIYESSGGVWKTQFNPIAATYPLDITWKVFSADLSLASDYTLVITDPNGSETEYLYTVSSTLPATGLSPSIATSRKQGFCTLYPGESRCPDGASLMPMSIEHTVGGVPALTAIADRTSHIDVRIHPRDRYGNSITMGNLTIEYSTPISVIQTLDSPYYSAIRNPAPFTVSVPGDAVVLSGVTVFNIGDGTSISGNIPMIGQDIFYGFSSYAPGTIQLTSLRYNGIDAGIMTLPLTMTPWYTLTDFTSSDLRIGSGVTFTATLTNNSSRVDTNPSIIHGLSIASNYFATFTDLSPSAGTICRADQITMNYIGVCNWLRIWGRTTPSIIAETRPSTTTVYTFTGKYTPLIALPYVPPEPVSVSSYISYDVDGNTVIYPTTSYSLGNSNFQYLRIRILGQSREIGWYSGIKSDRQVRVDFLNTLRKNITLLTRNRVEYSQANFSHTGSDIHIGNAHFASKRTIIAEGWDITIDENITGHDTPLAIISLRNPQTGSGGTITIHSGVTDIHATLIAEASISSSGSNQLYIYGTVVSNNTLGWASRSPLECPYFDNQTCPLSKAKQYDFETLRNDYLLLADKTGHIGMALTAQRFADTALIIEYDPRIQWDPPPGLAQ